MSIKDDGGLDLQIVGKQEDVSPLFNGLCLATGTILKFEKQFDKKSGYVIDKIIGFESVDDRFSEEQKKLQALIDNPIMSTLTCDDEAAGLYGGGSYNPNTYTAALSHGGLNGKSYYKRFFTSEEKKNLQTLLISLFGFNATTEYFDVWDLIAHELLGHGYDEITGHRQDEQNARDTANKVRQKRGKHLRVPVGHPQD